MIILWNSWLFCSWVQWRIYIEAKEAVLGAPGLKGPPQIYKIKQKWLQNNDTAERR